MNKKICLIILYFGKLPNYFDLWLNSCRYNSSIDFLLFTDDCTEYNYPENVRVVYTSFEEIKKEIQKKFDFKISLNYRYKLCDYKPVYGYIFQEYIKDYDFWGHCDVDTIWGDIRKYLDDSILEKNDKIFLHGHFTLYKNIKRINENFKELIDSDTNKPLYLKVYSNDGSFYFDEFAGIINLYDNKKYKIYKNIEIIADIDLKYNNFYVISNRQNGKYIFKWQVDKNTSKLYGIYSKNNKLVYQEFMYIHLQKRKMINNIVKNKDEFLIVPDKFIYAEDNVTLKEFKKMNKPIKMKRKEFYKLRINRGIQKIFKKGNKKI